MYSTTTNGIEINVEVFYEKDSSNAFNHEFGFSYRITINNQNKFAVQLLKRTWHIFDSCGEYRMVEGEGVVGQTPVIFFHKPFTYISACFLKSEMGKMYGTYTMLNLQNNKEFEVIIPAFNLVAPSKLN
ncbi:MAG: Co2+/Mg2+ efflux protein ApaG [Chitinophagaceae bacterium]